MKVLKLSFAILIAACTITGCGFSNYLTQNQNQNSTTVVLSQNNYSIIGTVEAQTSAEYIFGIGGIGKNALYSNSMSELLKKAQLKRSQALINISTKTHVETCLIWSRYTVLTLGTIIEFKDNKSTTPDISIIPETTSHNHQEETEEPQDKDNRNRAKYKDYLKKEEEIQNEINQGNIETAASLFKDLKEWYSNYKESNKYIESDMSTLERTIKKCIQR